MYRGLLNTWETRWQPPYKHGLGHSGVLGQVMPRYECLHIYTYSGIHVQHRSVSSSGWRTIYVTNIHYRMYKWIEMSIDIVYWYCMYTCIYNHTNVYTYMYTCVYGTGGGGRERERERERERVRVRERINKETRSMKVLTLCLSFTVDHGGNLFSHLNTLCLTPNMVIYILVETGLSQMHTSKQYSMHFCSKNLHQKRPPLDLYKKRYVQSEIYIRSVIPAL